MVSNMTGARNLNFYTSRADELIVCKSQKKKTEFLKKLESLSYNHFFNREIHSMVRNLNKHEFVVTENNSDTSFGVDIINLVGKCDKMKEKALAALPGDLKELVSLLNSNDISKAVAVLDRILPLQELCSANEELDKLKNLKSTLLYLHADQQRTGSDKDFSEEAVQLLLADQIEILKNIHLAAIK